MPRESIDERRARLMPGARWIRAERERRGWTGTELARRLGLQQTRLSAYERAQDEPPPEVARSLADVFGMTELSVWQHLGKAYPRELTHEDIRAMTREEVIAYVRRLHPGAIEEALDQGPEVSREDPSAKRKRRPRSAEGVTRPDEPGRRQSRG